MKVLYEHKLSRRVSFHETDQAGLVHFSNLFCYVEEAEAGLFRSLGQGDLNRVWGAARDGIGWVRIRAELDFLNAARLDDLLEVHVWVKEKTSRGLSLGARISNDHVIIAQGLIKTLCVRQTDAGPKVQAIPKAIDDALDTAPWGEDWPPSGR